MLAKVPSGRTITALKVPSVSGVWKIPGVAATTGMLVDAVPPPTLIVTVVPLEGAASQGTSKVICCELPTVPTLKIGAAVPPIVTVALPSVRGQGPKGLYGSCRRSEEHT